MVLEGYPALSHPQRPLPFEGFAPPSRTIAYLRIFLVWRFRRGTLARRKSGYVIEESP